MHVLRPAIAWLVPATALCLLSGCEFEPAHDDLHYSLSDATLATLATLETDGFTAVAPQIEGALELYFGTPQQPAFLQTEEWIDDGYNPNWPTYAEDDDGSGEFTEEQLEAIYAANERYYARELRLIEEGEYKRIKGFRTAPSLDEKWFDLVAAFEGPEESELEEEDDSGEEDADSEEESEDDEEEESETLSEEEFKEEARDLLIEFYPQLRDSAEMYRQQCLHCHGVNGGGDGPTSEFLNPLPRDYRKGIFKFTAVKDKGMPRRADLFRILAEGVKGTAMPPFRRFSDAQINGLADYVRFLAIRGQMEELLVLEILEDEKLVPTKLESSYVDIWEGWQNAEEGFFFFDGEVPEATPERIARGREIYMNATAGNCQSCHGDYGRGDGPAALVTTTVGDETKPVYGDDGKQLSAYEDDWGHPIYPRNLTQRMFRGGSRPIDIYRRIYAGINGTPMPAIGESKNAEGDLVIPPDDMWSLVHYVKSLSDGADHRVVVAGHDSDDGHGSGHDSEAGHADDGEDHGDEHSDNEEGH